MITINNMVACKPLENTAVKSKQVGTLQLGDFGAGGKLLALTTVVDFCATVRENYIHIKAGSRVYVKADCVAQPWPKAVCTCVDVRDSEGKETPFVLVPIDQIVMHSSDV
jgi:hypothetical protein